MKSLFQSLHSRNTEEGECRHIWSQIIQQEEQTLTYVQEQFSTTAANHLQQAEVQI